MIPLERFGMIDMAVQEHGVPHAICMELLLPDTYDVSGVSEARALFPNAPIVVISGSPDPDAGAKSLAAGAAAYLDKRLSRADILKGIRSVLDPAASELIDGITLSKCQKQLLRMLDLGMSNRQIAEALGISEHTVKVHLWRLFRRLGVASRTQSTHFARVHGLLV